MTRSSVVVLFVLVASASATVWQYLVRRRPSATTFANSASYSINHSIEYDSLIREIDRNY